MLTNILNQFVSERFALYPKVERRLQHWALTKLNHCVQFSFYQRPCWRLAALAATAQSDVDDSERTSCARTLDHLPPGTMLRVKCWLSEPTLSQY